MRDRVFGRHADAAVQLDGLLRDMAAGPADLQLGPRGHHGVEAPIGHTHRGIEVHAAGQFQ